MKIVVYFNSMAPAGGIERVISNHISFLLRGNHDIILITKDDQNSFYPIPDSVIHESLKIDTALDMNNRIKRVFQIGSTLFKTVFYLKKIIYKYEPDIVYVAHPLCLLEFYLSGINCKKIFVTEHSSVNAYNKIYRLILNLLYPKVGLLTVPTTQDSNLYTSLGIKNVYLPNPLPFYPKNQSALQNKCVLNIGRLTNDKRHELLIKIWHGTKGRFYGWKLKIFGKGENFDKINNLIDVLDLRESVFLFPPTKEIEKEYNSASIFALTSVAEGFGLVLAEAMASGVPCVSFNCPSGPKDIISDNINGYLIEEGDEQSYVDRLDELMNNYALRKKFGENARIDIKKFDGKVISEKINDLVIERFNGK